MQSPRRTISRFRPHLLAPFCGAGRISLPLLGLFLSINGLVLINALRHDPAVGYDANYHLAYIETLAQGRLPAPEESKEYFSPPLPYVFPALLMAWGRVGVWGAAKGAQLLNVGLSIGLTYGVLRTCDLIRPGNIGFKAIALVFLGIVPTYYKAFAFVRGEPFVALWTVLAVYQVIRIYVQGARALWRVLILGVWMGLLILSRQWGILVLPALGLFVGLLVLRQRVQARWYLASLVASLVVALIVGGWFFLGLRARYGTMTAFNRTPMDHFSFRNQPASFYFGLGDGKLFTAPVRSSFPNQLLPILYADLWGDYWGYFTIYARDLNTGLYMAVAALGGIHTAAEVPVWVDTNRFTFQGYLGRVNLVSLFPSLWIAAGLVGGAVNLWRLIRRPGVRPQGAALALFVLMVATTMAGYFWFLIMYPSLDKGNTIKAVFLLHLFPYTGLMAADLLQDVQRRSAAAYRVVLIALALVWAHNLPAMISRYP